MNDKTTESMIAVVDDDESVRRSLGRFLKASGFQPLYFRSAEAFLAYSQLPQFDCLIADLQLEGMSGLDLKERLMSAGVNIPMILLTGCDAREPDHLAQQAHGAILMRKSDPGEALIAALRRAVHQYRHPEEDRRDGGNSLR